MEACCSFKSLVGGICSADSKDRKREANIIPLVSCDKNVSKHKSAFKFAGPEDEIELILCRAGIFSRTKDVKSMTICPHHRAKLGLGWSRGASTRCRVPATLSGHGKSKSGWPKGERGMSKEESQNLLLKTGTLVQVGSGKIHTQL
jgi:hypothetical protein